MKNKALWLVLQVWRCLRSCETPWATRASGGKDADAKADEPICAKFLSPLFQLFLSQDGSFRFYCNNCARRSSQQAWRGRRAKRDAGASRVAFPRWSMGM